MTAHEIARMILDSFANVGECVSVYGRCEECKHFNICNTIATAFRMVLDGEYYG